MTTGSAGQALALRPLGVGELLDQAVRLYRRNFVTLIGIVAVVQIPLAVVQLGFPLLAGRSGLFAVSSGRSATVSASTASLAATLGNLAVVLFGSLVLSGVSRAAVAGLVADNLFGKSISFSGAFHQIGRSWLPLIGTMVLTGIIAVALLIWFIVPCLGWATGLGMLAFFYYIVAAVIPAVVVVEHRGGYGAVRRSWDLVRRRFWPAIGFTALILVFSAIVTYGTNLLAGAAVRGLARTGSASLAGQGSAQVIVQSLLDLLIRLLVQPLTHVAIAMYYLDIRVRTEGLDLALLTMDASAPGEPEAVLTGPAAQAGATGTLFTWPELGSFLVLTIGFIGLAVLIGRAVGAVGSTIAGLTG